MPLEPCEEPYRVVANLCMRVHLANEGLRSPGVLGFLSEAIHLVRVATVRPSVCLDGSSLREEPDEPCDPVGVSSRQECGDHASVSRREERRTALTGRVEDREKVGGPRLEVGEARHAPRRR